MSYTYKDNIPLQNVGILILASQDENTQLHSNPCSATPSQIQSFTYPSINPPSGNQNLIQYAIASNPVTLDLRWVNECHGA